MKCSPTTFSATYENARKKISKSEYTSSLSSDPDHPQEKRRRRPPTKWTDDDDLPQIMPSAERASAAVPAVPDDFPQGNIWNIVTHDTQSQHLL